MDHQRHLADPATRDAEAAGAPRRVRGIQPGMVALQGMVGNRGMRTLARRPAHPLSGQIEAGQVSLKGGRLGAIHDMVRANLTYPGGDRWGMLSSERVLESMLLGGKKRGSLIFTPTASQQEAMVERGYALGKVAAHGTRSGLDFARKHAKTPQAREQIELVRKDIDIFKEEFRKRVKDNAYLLLDESERRIMQMLGGYGLVTAFADSLVKQAREWDEVDEVTDQWLENARKGQRARYERAAGARGDLTATINRLRTLQKAVVTLQSDYIRTHRETPLDEGERRHADKVRRKMGSFLKPDATPAAKQDEKEINEARRVLATAWAEAERKHPVLAAHRTDAGDHLEWIDLKSYAKPWTMPVDDEGNRLRMIRAAERSLRGTASGATHERAAVKAAVQRLANIRTARLAIKGGKLSPLKLAPVVRFTEKQLFVHPKGAWGKVVREIVSPDKGFAAQGFEFLKGLFDLAMMGLSMIPGPGQPLAVLYDAGRSAYVAMDEYIKYDLETAYTNTDLDRARSLSDKVPSLTGFMLALAGAGVSAAQLKGAFEAAAAARRGLLSADGDEIRAAMNELDKIGERHGVKGLGDEVARAEGVNVARPATTQPPSGGSAGGKTAPPAKAPRPSKSDVAPPDRPKRPREAPKSPKAPKGAVAAIPEAVKKTVKAIRTQIRKAFKGAKTGMKPADLPEHYKLLQNLLKTNGIDARTTKAIEEVMTALRDPDLYGEVLAEAYTRWMAKGTSMREEILAMAREGGLDIAIIRPSPTGELLDAKVFYEQYASQARAIVDEGLKFDEAANALHGELTHIIQDLVVDLGLKRAAKRTAGLPRTSGEFRKSLQSLSQQVKFPDVLNGDVLKDMPLGEAVWRSTYDLFDRGLKHLPTPEVTMPRLRKALEEALKVKSAPID